jgi:hypothetical protein
MWSARSVKDASAQLRWSSLAGFANKTLDHCFRDESLFAAGFGERPLAAATVVNPKLFENA